MLKGRSGSQQQEQISPNLGPCFLDEPFTRFSNKITLEGLAKGLSPLKKKKKGWIGNCNLLAQYIDSNNISRIFLQVL